MTRREIERMARDVVKAGRDQIEWAEAFMTWRGTINDGYFWEQSSISCLQANFTCPSLAPMSHPVHAARVPASTRNIRNPAIFAKARELEKALRMNI